MDDTPNTIGGFTAPERSYGASRRGRNKLIIFVVLLFVLGLGTYLVLSSMQKKDTDTADDKETVAIQPTQEPTEPTEEPDGTPSPTRRVTPTGAADTEVTVAQDMKIQVLNGSGEVGVAGQGAEFLKGKGYKTVETGNADNYDYEDVTVNIKASRKKFLDTLVTSLEEKYTVNAEAGTLEDSSDYDATVIIGK